MMPHAQTMFIDGSNMFSALDVVAWGLALPGPTCPKNESF